MGTEQSAHLWASLSRLCFNKSWFLEASAALIAAAPMPQPRQIPATIVMRAYVRASSEVGGSVESIYLSTHE